MDESQTAQIDRLTDDLRRTQNLNSAMMTELAKVTLYSRECATNMNEYKGKLDSLTDENTSLKKQLRDALIMIDEQSRLRKLANEKIVEGTHPPPTRYATPPPRTTAEYREVLRASSPQSQVSASPRVASPIRVSSPSAPRVTRVSTPRKTSSPTQRIHRSFQQSTAPSPPHVGLLPPRDNGSLAKEERRKELHLLASMVKSLQDSTVLRAPPKGSPKAAPFKM